MKTIRIMIACFSLSYLFGSWQIFAQKTVYGNTLSAEERTFLVKTLNASLQKFENAIIGLSNEDLNFKATSKKWSVAECIEHVTLAERRFPQIVQEEMIKPSMPEYRKKIRIKDEKIRPKMLSRVWRARSPEIFKPIGQFASTEEALHTFRMQRQNTISYVQTTQDDLRHHFWRHPLTGTIDLYQTLLLMSAHLERHTEQIEDIKKVLGAQ